ncbi:MAG: sialidase family protein, partial [Halioglobus sp.]|nr:sialidase family protein [Halioglobus sp.]
PLGDGNEAEIAELSDGRLYMATRHVAPIGRPPPPGGRLYALSGDGGDSWSGVGFDTALPTPVCQASVIGAGQRLLFSNPAHRRARVAMTVRTSDDDGASWRRALQVYPGPAGYSQLGVLEDGGAVLLYERGRLSYSERISFARLPRLEDAGDIAGAQQ